MANFDQNQGQKPLWKNLNFFFIFLTFKQSFQDCNSIGRI